MVQAPRFLNLEATHNLAGGLDEKTHEQKELFSDISGNQPK